MLYTAGEIILFLVASALIGLVIGYFSWARGGSKAPDDEAERLRRQLNATRKRAAAAEGELTTRTEALKEAHARLDAQLRRIRDLQQQLPDSGTPSGAPEQESNE